MVQNSLLGCLCCEVTRWEGTDSAGGPVHDDEDLVEPAGAVREVTGVDDEILTREVGVSPLSSK